LTLRRREQIENLHTLGFMLLGPPGAGTTHLAPVALAPRGTS